MPIKPGKNCEYAIWFFPKRLSLQPVSEQEINWSNKFSPKRAREFLYSRGYIRKCISELFCIDRKSVPIFAPPGRPPKLQNGFGNISISHCKDALLIGWSFNPIGIDIEISNRSINYERIVKKFFFNEEKRTISEMNFPESKNKFLSFWVLKEAAIKLQKGSIYKDLENWETKENKIINNSINKKLFSYCVSYKLWKIGVVFESKLKITSPLICIN